MNDNLEGALTIIGIIAIFYIVVGGMIFTGGLETKYSCQDLSDLGVDAEHSIRYSVFMLPYHHCRVSIEGVPYSLFSEEVKIKELLGNSTTDNPVVNIKNKVVINGNN